MNPSSSLIELKSMMKSSSILDVRMLKTKSLQMKSVPDSDFDGP